MPGGLLGLAENPFSEGHDARFLYPSRAHWEAVTRLRSAVDDREPFVYLTGPAGCGKTTALLEFLAGVESHAAVVIAAVPSLTRAQFRERILAGLGFEPPGTPTHQRSADRVDELLREMHARGDVVLLVVDESQNLSSELLEELMVLSELEIDGRKLLQIILAGRPVLERLLSRPGCEALRPRFTVRCWLGAFSAEETAGYIRHRVSVVPGASRSLFPSDSCQAVYRLTHGIPRDINLLASEALVQAQAAGAGTVKPGHVAAAARVIGLVGLEAGTWVARLVRPYGAADTDSRTGAAPPLSEALESCAEDAAGQGSSSAPLPHGPGARGRAMPGRETPRRGRPSGTMARAAGAVLIVAASFVLSMVSRNAMRGGAAYRPAATTPAVKANGARIFRASRGAPGVRSITPAAPSVPPARTSAVTPQPGSAPRRPGPGAWAPRPAAVPNAVRSAPAPGAPMHRYGIEVATFIVESRAVQERDKLARSIPVGCRVVTALEDGAWVYRVVVGPLTSRSEADSLGADLSEHGVVGEARVVRWTATEDSRH